MADPTGQRRGRRIATALVGMIAAMAAVGWTAPASGTRAPDTGRSTGTAACSVPVLPAPARGEAAVAALGGQLVAAAARNGLTGRELASQLRADRTLWVDTCGLLFFVDELPSSEATADEPAVASATGDVTGSAAPWPATIPATDAFLLHSRPGSDRVLFLDFDGHQVSGTAWKSADGASDWAAPAFSTDADRTTFTDAERAIVIDAWRRVAQDFAPFDVDVTTQDPGQDAITRSDATDTRFGTRVLVSPDARQSLCGCGGQAYVNVFARTTSHAYYQPAWVFPQALSNSAKSIAEAASHEAGHTLGLRHDGTTTATYYGGSGGWGPIMGSAYAQAVTQWSNGSYAGANNVEDDVALIAANGAPLLVDDVGGTSATARALVVPGATTGTLNARTDADWYQVDVAAGALGVTATPHWPGPNADLGLVVTDASGVVLAAHAPPYSATGVQASVGASVALTVPAGRYFVAVEGTGNGVVGSPGESDYGSLGWYSLTVDGVGTAPTEPPPPTSPPPTTTPTSPPPTEPPPPTGPTLQGSAISLRSTWTARVTLVGAAGNVTSGSWTPGGAAGGCAIAPNATTCAFELTGLSKKTSVASFRDPVLGSVTITKP